jgi:DNA ligase (NAD+)
MEDGLIKQMDNCLSSLNAGECMDLEDYNYNCTVDILKVWADSYYNKGILLATDEEYDAMSALCKHYENRNPDKVRKDSPTVLVGALLAKQSKFKKDKHIEKMYSLDNVFNIEEFKDWYDKVTASDELKVMLGMDKYDGLSLNLYYENGILVKAITRGDGNIGENVTINARQIKNLPQRIGWTEPIEIRGEVVMTFDEFNRLNEERVSNGLEVFASPRNAAVGSLRNLDPKVTRDRNLVFMAWGVGMHNITYGHLSETLTRLSEIYTGLSENGFFCNYRLLRTFDDIVEYYQEKLKERDDLGYPIDGIVLKYNDLSLANELGFTNKFPRWAIAFKLPALEKTTKIVSIDNQVGKTGIITPVANVTPVDIDGVEVSRVTLHNYSELRAKDLKIGDNVIIIRSGDVIPKITVNLTDRRDGTEVDIPTPIKCPTCYTKLKEVGPNLFCINDDCHDKLFGKLIHFVSRDGANIDGMSEATIKVIDIDGYVEFDFFQYIKNLYKMTIDDFIVLDGFNIKKATNLYNAIQASKTIEMYKLLDGLSIPNIGTTASKAIVKKYGLNVLHLTTDDLKSIDGIGEVQAKSYVNFMNLHRDIIQDLMIFTFNVINTLVEEVDLPLVAITGKFPIPRTDIIEMLKANYKYTDKINKNTSLLIVGDDASSKLEKAKKLGIQIKTFEELVK